MGDLGAFRAGITPSVVAADHRWWLRKAAVVLLQIVQDEYNYKLSTVNIE